MKPIVIIAISVVCSVVAIGVIELIIYGVDSGEEIRSIGTEKYVLIPQILAEVQGMSIEEAGIYQRDNYRDNPLYSEECKRLWYQFNDVPIKERPSEEEIKTIIYVFKWACRVPIINP